MTYLLTLEELKINIRDEDGQTPLMVATMYGNTRIVRRLLMKGANRLIRNNEMVMEQQRQAKESW